jgi:hypothetical protein
MTPHKSTWVCRVLPGLATLFIIGLPLPGHALYTELDDVNAHEAAKKALALLGPSKGAVSVDMSPSIDITSTSI